MTLRMCVLSREGERAGERKTEGETACSIDCKLCTPTATTGRKLEHFIQNATILVSSTTKKNCTFHPVPACIYASTSGAVATSSASSASGATCLVGCTLGQPPALGSSEEKAPTCESKNALSPQRFLCLSRACLGKQIASPLHIYKWIKKRRFSFAPRAPSPRSPPSFSSSRPPACRSAPHRSSSGSSRWWSSRRHPGRRRSTERCTSPLRHLPFRSRRSRWRTFQRQAAARCSPIRRQASRCLCTHPPLGSARKRSVFEFTPCVPRACLCKMIIHRNKWLKKTVLAHRVPPAAKHAARDVTGAAVSAAVMLLVRGETLAIVPVV